VVAYWSGINSCDDDRARLFALLGQSRPGWHADALCKEYPQLPWIPERGVSLALVGAMRGVCGRCLVRAECLAAADENTAGVWGGTTFLERRALRTGAA
jgi:hypothetical protein